MSKVLDLVHRQILDRLVECCDAESRVRHFGCRQPLMAMALAQMTWWEGLRNIADCLNARPTARFPLGFREPIAESTLTDANEQRDWWLWVDLAKNLMRKTRRLYAGEKLGFELANTVDALDYMTIDLSLTLCLRTTFRRSEAWIKLHTQIDLRGLIPTCLHIIEVCQHDVVWLNVLGFEPEAFYVLDRGDLDFQGLNKMVRAGALVVTCAKDDLRLSRQSSRPLDPATGLPSDQTRKLSLKTRAVVWHLYAIYRRLHVHSRTQAVKQTSGLQAHRRLRNPDAGPFSSPRHGLSSPR